MPSTLHVHCVQPPAPSGPAHVAPGEGHFAPCTQACGGAEASEGGGGAPAHDPHWYVPSAPHVQVMHPPSGLFASHIMPCARQAPPCTQLGGGGAAPPSIGGGWVPPHGAHWYKPVWSHLHVMH